MATLPGPGVWAMAPAADGEDGRLLLRIHPGGGAQPTGAPQVVEVQVERPNGDGVDGVEVDLEVTEGPGDDDVGTAGHTPQSPDLSCTTAGGAKKKPATCTVTYTEQDNAGGSDAVLAWIDADQENGTVEADLEEGENPNTAGSGGCRAGSKGPGAMPEPDGTDCAEKRWRQRVATTVDLEAETGSEVLGGTTALVATVFDQFGNPLTGPGTSTSVHFELLAGSSNDAGDGSDFEVADLGTCTTDAVGGCSAYYAPTIVGADSVCAYLSGAAADCSESRDAPERDNGADVVTRTWELPAAPPTPDRPDDDPGTVVPPPAPPDPPAAPDPDPDTEADEPREPGSDRDEPHENRRDDDSGGAERAPGPAGAGAAAALMQSGGGKGATAAPERQRPRRRPAAGGTHRRGAKRRKSNVPAAGVHGSRRTATGAHRRRAHRAEGALDELAKAAVTTAERFSFPLSLTLLVVLFIAVQGRIDRQDPKLRLAPIDSEHDLMEFA